MNYCRLAGVPGVLREEYDSKCAVHATTKSDLEARRKERQKEVRSIIEAAANVPPGRVF